MFRCERLWSADLHEYESADDKKKESFVGKLGDASAINSPELRAKSPEREITPQTCKPLHREKEQEHKSAFT